MLGELVPRLCELLKSGVGLGTKVNSSVVMNQFTNAFISHFFGFLFELHIHAFTRFFFTNLAVLQISCEKSVCPFLPVFLREAVQV